ncbi:Breast carcinoma-amplified sequence 4 [Saguinus oedipus]|uniref:Breast carcinoma-amplified sequence 4 n=1 Tax=Saguinus oedipus TaxID=9490 RepID=A0ABQ9VLQ4_SAGOE|nr:Breast carcinoma-amplified sequence 4 [Saguinus oedipus]
MASHTVCAFLSVSGPGCGEWRGRGGFNQSSVMGARTAARLLLFQMRQWKGAKEVEETIEGMLLRLEEFCSLTHLGGTNGKAGVLQPLGLHSLTPRFEYLLETSGQIRSDTSQILEEHIPVLKAKLTEMRGIYAKVDRLEVCPGK